MSSETLFATGLIHRSDPFLFELSTPTGIGSNRLLSPITERSAEILLTPLRPIQSSTSDSPRPSPSIVLPADPLLTTNDWTTALLQRFTQYTTNFHAIQTHLHSIGGHLKESASIIDRLRNEKTIANVIDSIDMRLPQLLAKRDQIDGLLNHVSIRQIIEQVGRERRRSVCTALCLPVSRFHHGRTKRS